MIPIEKYVLRVLWVLIASCAGPLTAFSNLVPRVGENRTGQSIRVASGDASFEEFAGAQALSVTLIWHAGVGWKVPMLPRSVQYLIWGCQGGDWASVPLPAAEDVPELRVLQLRGGSSYGVYDESVFRTIAKYPNLSELVLESGKVDSQSIRALGNSQIRRIHVRTGELGRFDPVHNQFSYQGSIFAANWAMDALGQIATLETIVWDAGLVPAAAFISVARLKNLAELSSRYLSDDAISVICTGSPTLRTLDISRSTYRVTDRCIGFLCDLKSLDSLDISWCPQIGWLADEHLKKLVGLRRLYLNCLSNSRDYGSYDSDVYPHLDHDKPRRASLEFLPGSARIEELSIVGVPFRRGQFEQHRASLVQLRSLDISQCPADCLAP